MAANHFIQSGVKARPSGGLLSSSSAAEILRIVANLEDSVYFQLSTAGHAIEDLGSFLYAIDSGDIEDMSRQDLKGVILSVQALGSHVRNLSEQVESKAATIRRLVDQKEDRSGEDE